MQKLRDIYLQTQLTSVLYELSHLIRFDEHDCHFPYPYTNTGNSNSGEENTVYNYCKRYESTVTFCLLVTIKVIVYCCCLWSLVLLNLDIVGTQTHTHMCSTSGHECTNTHAHMYTMKAYRHCSQLLDFLRTSKTRCPHCVRCGGPHALCSRQRRQVERAGEKRTARACPPPERISFCSFLNVRSRPPLCLD